MNRKTIVIQLEPPYGKSVTLNCRSSSALGVLSSFQKLSVSAVVLIPVMLTVYQEFKTHSKADGTNSASTISSCLGCWTLSSTSFLFNSAILVRLLSSLLPS